MGRLLGEITNLYWFMNSPRAKRPLLRKVKLKATLVAFFITGPKRISTAR